MLLLRVFEICASSHTEPKLTLHSTSRSTHRAWVNAPYLICHRQQSELQVEISSG